MIKHNKKRITGWKERDTYLTNTRRQGKTGPIAIGAHLLIIIWRDDGMIWRNDDMTNWSRWSLSYFGIRRDVVSVLSSNHFSS